ncbi:MAG: hypothetical protein WD887_00115 [Candidatus Saccharimonadales bacterium]
MTTAETAVEIPKHHGEAHQELSDSRCAFSDGRIGCNLIDVAKGTVGINGERAHQETLIEIAKHIGNKACETCKLRVWAAKELTGSEQGQ